mmetsp:Transcript_14987/g.20268  ORF Transcript_14987/g.20268 Transcript_14987/m.20268 type:complete len:84 (+) Transcript_14987:1111-1362(+)
MGRHVLIEDVLEDIDPGLDTILTKTLIDEDGIKKINFNDRKVDYNDNFHIQLTTKMANPHFMPEVCIKLTIINFTVTFFGLEE